jgi:hypothetical protein
MAEQPDPFDALRHPKAREVERMLPPAEVRALGDRMRRRRTAFRAVAAAAAVAVVTTGGVALGGQLSGAPSPVPPASQVPSPQPSATKSVPTESPSPSLRESDSPDSHVWRTTIPERFPLAMGYPEARSVDARLVGPGPDVAAFGELSACRRSYEAVADEVDRLAVTFTQPEDVRARALTLHETDVAAQENLAGLAELFDSCPREEFGSGGAALVQVSEAAPGDDAFVAIRTWEQDGLPVPGLELIYVVRVGNALLLQSTYNEGGGNEKLIYA